MQQTHNPPARIVGLHDWSDPHYWYFENLEDPNERGHDAIRRLFLREIVTVLHRE